MNLRLYGVVFGAVLGLMGCGEPAAPTGGGGTEGGRPGLSGRVTLTGSSTIAPVVTEAGLAFEALYPDIRVDVQTGGSSRGIADAKKGLNDIGMTSRSLKAGEEPGLTPHVFAHDGVGFVVHTDNPVAGLTTAQAKSIYDGTITNWKELGGDDSAIVVVNRAEGRSELELVSKFLGLKPSQIRADVDAGENQQAVKLVAGNPAAVVYLSVGTAAYEAAAGTPIKLLKLDGVAASVETVLDGTFPLGRPLVLVTPEDGAESNAAAVFLNYLMSPAVDGLIKEQSFVVPPR